MNTLNYALVQKTQITKPPYFVGFSTVNKYAPPFTLTNIDLIKRDISNQFATPIGSRVMLPGFGSNIYNYLFDPFDEYTKNAIIEDAVRVVKSDPRVSLIKVDVTQSDKTLSVALLLKFKPESVTDNMFVTFSLYDKSTF